MQSFIGKRIDGRVIAEVGETIEMSGGPVFSVRFRDGKCGIAFKGNRLDLWEPDYEPAKLAIEQSKVVPTIRWGIGSDVVHIRGEDEHGTFLVKMFFNAKKNHYGRQDELRR